MATSLPSLPPIFVLPSSRGITARTSELLMLGLRHRQEILGSPWTGDLEFSNKSALVKRLRERGELEKLLAPGSDEFCAALRKKQLEAAERRHWQGRCTDLENLGKDQISEFVKHLADLKDSLRVLGSKKVDGVKDRLWGAEREREQKVKKGNRQIERHILGERKKYVDVCSRLGRVALDKRTDEMIFHEWLDFSNDRYARKDREGMNRRNGPGNSLVPNLLELSGIINKLESKRVLRPFSGKSVNDVLLEKAANLIREEVSTRSSIKVVEQVESIQSARKSKTETIRLDRTTEKAVLFLQRVLPGIVKEREMQKTYKLRRDLISEMVEIKNSMSPSIIQVAPNSTDNQKSFEIGRYLELLASEHERICEESRIAKQVEIAIDDRRKREAAEGGRRQKEEIHKQRQDAAFCSLQAVNREAFEPMWKEIVKDSVLFGGQVTGGEPANGGVQSSEVQADDDQMSVSTPVVVSDLLRGFLLPHVNRSKQLEQVRRGQVAAMIAARDVLESTLKKMT